MTGRWLHVRDEANGGALVAFERGVRVWAELYASPGAMTADFDCTDHLGFVPYKVPQDAIHVGERPGDR